MTEPQGAIAAGMPAPPQDGHDTAFAHHTIDNMSPSSADQGSKRPRGSEDGLGYDTGPDSASKRPRDDTGGVTLQHCPTMRHKHSQRIREPEELLVHMGAKFRLRKAKVFTNALEAVEYATELYDTSCDTIRDSWKAFAEGEHSVHQRTQHATYPMVGTQVDIRDMDRCRGTYAAYGVVKEPGYYGTTLTRMEVLGDYYKQQLLILKERYQVPLVVGLSDVPIPLPFVIDTKPHDVSARRQYEVHENFMLPDLGRINDHLPNGTASSNMNSEHLEGLLPLSLFNALRTDFSLQRLAHYCGTSPQYFQGFILLTNYQRYVDEFIAWAKTQVLVPGGASEYECLMGPHNTTLADASTQSEQPSACNGLPQMPAYHLVRKDGLGITIINIGVGPSNAKTITDHLAVLRPHCWLMLGHCAGLRMSQNLGDYLLAHAYVREDHVLDQDLPIWVPLPPIAEVQTALEQAMANVLRGSGIDVKTAMRTGTLVTTDDRDWELNSKDLRQRFKQSRAIGVDMESATIAGNGYRFRVPYGTLLCVSDKPLHGELKLQGMANEFYRQRTAEHLRIGLDAIRLLREQGVQRLQSRKLRGFDEPPFR